jgi:methyl-accepting chemotaxis protein
MQSPALGIRRRLLLFGVLPAVLILVGVLALNFTRVRAMLLSFAEEILAERVQVIATEIDRGTLEAVATAKLMAIAAQEELFGHRAESLAFARGVLAAHPQFTAAYYGYEPDADGQDAAAASSGLPAEALGEGGRFIPYWFRDRVDPTQIRLTPLVLIDGLYYEGCRQRFLDPALADKGMVTEPYDYEGKLIVEQTFPIVIDGRFQGVAGVDRTLDSMTAELERITVRQRERDWNLEIILVSRLGKVIASTVKSMELTSRPIGETPYADILGHFHGQIPEGETGLVEALDPVTRQQCFYAAAPVPTGDWTVVMAMPRADVVDRIRMPVLMLALAAGLGMLMVLSLLFRLSSRVVRRIERAAAAAQRVATGDLSDDSSLVADTAGAADETARLLRDIDAMTTSLRGIVSQVTRSSLDLTATARQLSAASTQQERVVQGFERSTAEAAAASREISVTGNELVSTMRGVADVAADTARVAAAGREDLAEVGNTMGRLEASTTGFADRLAAIRQRAEDINLVITTITKVADQTNLLSINAAIEAEKAGTHGHGFIVVAREIRRLADQTAVATLDIEQLVGQMQEAVAAGVGQMESFAAEVRAGVARVGNISGQFAAVIDKVQSLTGRFSQVNEGMQAQAAGASQIAESLVSLSEGSRAAADTIRELNDAASHMVESVSSLTATVSRFRGGEG